MKKNSLIAIFFALICSCQNEKPTLTVETPKEILLPEGNLIVWDSLTRNSNIFTLELFKKISDDKNLFISPFSIQSAMAMIYAGAAGNTEIEMSKIFHWPENSKSFHSALGGLNTNLQKNNNDKYTINTANRIFIEEQAKPFEEFSNINKKNYGADVYCVDFSKKTITTNIINKWVSDKTKKMIPSLLSPDDIDAAKMILVNTIYFYGQWALPFDEESTQKDSFYVSDSVKILTDFMLKSQNASEGKYNYRFFQNDKFSILDLPYEQNKGSMIILLPFADSTGNYENIDSLIHMTSAEEIDSMLNKLSSVSVPIEIKLPKWKFNYKINLVPFLQEMGLVSPFNSEADFSRITDSNLPISAIIHEAIIEVNEKGTEAAAATALIANETAVFIDPEDRIKFHVDRPFIYLLKDNISGLILFIGKMNQPN